MHSKPTQYFNKIDILKCNNYTSVEAGVYGKCFSLESDDHPRGQASQHQGSSDGGNVEMSSNHSLQPCFLYRVTLGVLQAL